MFHSEAVVRPSGNSSLDDGISSGTSATDVSITDVRSLAPLPGSLAVEGKIENVSDATFSGIGMIH